MQAILSWSPDGFAYAGNVKPNCAITSCIRLRIHGQLLRGESHRNICENFATVSRAPSSGLCSAIIVCAVERQYYSHVTTSTCPSVIQQLCTNCKDAICLRGQSCVLLSPSNTYVQPFSGLFWNFPGPNSPAAPCIFSPASRHRSFVRINH